ncbi:MAG TPA: outer membrane protein assembly factor BamD, partial [Microvirga sp.]|nr:outer membrane protein assembly factor BamD [Microvirga sp.]
MSFAKVYLGLRAAVGRTLLVGACGLTLAGCDTLSSINPFDKNDAYKPEIVADVPAEQIYNDGLARIQKRDFEGAAKKFNSLDRQYPYSEWARKGLIMEAYANYEGGLYEEAITASRRYLQQHPNTPDAAYAQYLMASSYYDQIPDITRDQAASERAIAALQDLVQRYPQSEYV